ncbi:MAG TPA: hypothetical protein VE965_02510, partial [Gammaproteobacteria bacterium]|nr:hypothetical protein [Gammaproteobacteria bacterium]
VRVYGGLLRLRVSHRLWPALGVADHVGEAPDPMVGVVEVPSPSVLLEAAQQAIWEHRGVTPHTG